MNPYNGTGEEIGVKELCEELTRMAESLELHHVKRDPDWLRPESLRGLLRLMLYLLQELSVNSGGYDSDK